MRIYISVDMEGPSGIVHLRQVLPGEREYDRSVALLTGEVNAAIAGAFEGGATEVLVNDAHDSQRNLRIEDLDPRAELITGSPKPLGMMEGVDSGVDGALFVGYHAMAGTAQASIDHTYSLAPHRVWVNGREMGEAGLNALVAGRSGVPILLVSGDQQLAAEARALLGEQLVAVQVKTAISRGAARCLPVAEARRRVREGAREAVRRLVEGRAPKPLTLASPHVVEIEFADSDMALRASLLPDSEQVGGRTVRYRHADYLQAWRGFRAMLRLSS